MTFAGVRGYVLAGGESSRMQRPDLPRDKALLLFEGETLLQRALRTVAQVCESASILCGTPARCDRLGRYGRTVSDRTPLCGPLGGLDAALQDAVLAGADAILMVPVDMPHLSAAALRMLVNRADASSAEVACLRFENFVQPLPAYVRVGGGHAVANALEAGDRKLLPTLRRIAPAEGFCAVDAEGCGCPQDEVEQWFVNVNTPGDLQSAQQLGNASKAAASE